MPDIDVSDLLFDPDVVECGGVTVQRRQEIVDSHGRLTLQIATFSNVIASVIPIADAPMIRGPEQQTLPQLIEVHTTFRLQGIASGFQPDIVVWNGTPFVVNKVQNFSKYGGGFVQADCSSISNIDQPPSGPAT
jgi:hypothetical protein